MIQWKGDAGLQLETADRWKVWVYGRRPTLIDTVTNVPLFTPSDWNHSWQKWSKHAQAIQNHWNESKPKPYSKSHITTKQCNAKVTQRRTHSAPIHTNRCQPFTCFLKRWVHPSISQSSNFTRFTTLWCLQQINIWIWTLYYRKRFTSFHSNPDQGTTTPRFWSFPIWELDGGATPSKAESIKVGPAPSDCKEEGRKDLVRLMATNGCLAHSQPHALSMVTVLQIVMRIDCLMSVLKSISNLCDCWMFYIPFKNQIGIPSNGIPTSSCKRTPRTHTKHGGGILFLIIVYYYFYHCDKLWIWGGLKIPLLECIQNPGLASCTSCLGGWFTACCWSYNV